MTLASLNFATISATGALRAVFARANPLKCATKFVTGADTNRRVVVVVLARRSMILFYELVAYALNARS